MAKKNSKEERDKRRAQRNNKEDQNERAKSWLREWADALMFAAIAAIIIRTFFFEAYRIPTPSMEESLLTGDFLIVSKISYGPRSPMVLGIPFTNIYLPGIVFPWTRLPGFTDIERNDIVVFNYPIDLGPISTKTNYVKRSIGMPHDTLSIKDKQVFINGEKAKHFEGLQQTYLVNVQENVRLSPAKVEAMGGTIFSARGPGSYRVNMTKSEADEISQWAEVTSVKPFILPEDLNEYNRLDFSFSSGFVNHHQLPSIVIPFEGQTVTLTPENWHIYELIVRRYEENRVEIKGDQFIINGESTNQYTIKQDYYFMMGDNRDNSEDSRFWGFVPQTHIVGKAGIIYFSWDSERFMPRFDRILDFIHKD